MLIETLKERKQIKSDQKKLSKICMMINNYQFGKNNPYELIREIKNVLNQND